MRTLATAGLAALVAAAALMLVPALLGYGRYVITGGSMGSALPRGSIAYEKPVPVRRLRVGDVITYTPPASAGVEGRVTHRIVAIGQGGVMRTKGDANAAPDPWRFTLARAAQPVERFHLPLAGYVIAALAIRVVRVLVIGLPALAVAFVSFARVWRDVRPVVA